MAGSDRIRYITSRDQIPKQHRHHYHAIAESREGVFGPFSVLLNSPELAGRVGNLGTYVRFEGELPDADRELAILTTARAFDCAFEWAIHVPIARDAGVREGAIDVVADEKPADELDERERIVVEYGRELFGDHRVSEGTYDAAFDRFGRSGITELTGTMGYYSLIAAILNAFEVRPDVDLPELP